MKTINELIQLKAEKILKIEEEKLNKFKENPYFNPDYHKSPLLEEIIKELKEQIYFNIPKRYIDAEIENENLWNEIQENYKNRKGFYFYGTVGTGKTYLLLEFIGISFKFTESVWRKRKRRNNRPKN